MPGALDSCINNVYEPGNIPASSGLPPVRVLLKDPLEATISETAAALDSTTSSIGYYGDGVGGGAAVDAQTRSDRGAAERARCCRACLSIPTARRARPMSTASWSICEVATWQSITSGRALAARNNGSSWANAFTTLTTAFATEVAGDTLYVAHDHAESTASAVTLTSSGTVANPTKVICVNRAGSVPPVSADRRATAQVTTTGTASITFAGFAHYDGIIFNAGNSSGDGEHQRSGSGSAVRMRFDNCSLRLSARPVRRAGSLSAATVGGSLCRAEQHDGVVCRSRPGHQRSAAC